MELVSENKISGQPEEKDLKERAACYGTNEQQASHYSPQGDFLKIVAGQSESKDTKTEGPEAITNPVMDVIAPLIEASALKVESVIQAKSVVDLTAKKSRNHVGLNFKALFQNHTQDAPVESPIKSTVLENFAAPVVITCKKLNGVLNLAGADVKDSVESNKPPAANLLSPEESTNAFALEVKSLPTSASQAFEHFPEVTNSSPTKMPTSEAISSTEASFIPRVGPEVKLVSCEGLESPLSAVFHEQLQTIHTQSTTHDVVHVVSLHNCIFSPAKEIESVCDVLADNNIHVEEINVVQCEPEKIDVNIQSPGIAEVVIPSKEEEPELISVEVQFPEIINIATLCKEQNPEPEDEKHTSATKNPQNAKELNAECGRTMEVEAVAIQPDSAKGENSATEPTSEETKADEQRIPGASKSCSIELVDLLKTNGGPHNFKSLTQEIFRDEASGLNSCETIASKSSYVHSQGLESTALGISGPTERLEKKQTKLGQVEAKLSLEVPLVSDDVIPAALTRAESAIETALVEAIMEGRDEEKAGLSLVVAKPEIDINDSKQQLKLVKPDECAFSKIGNIINATSSSSPIRARELQDMAQQSIQDNTALRDEILCQARLAIEGVSQRCFTEDGDAAKIRADKDYLYCELERNLKSMKKFPLKLRRILFARASGSSVKIEACVARDGKKGSKHVSLKLTFPSAEIARVWADDLLKIVYQGQMFKVLSKTGVIFINSGVNTPQLEKLVTGYTSPATTICEKAVNVKSIPFSKADITCGINELELDLLNSLTFICRDDDDIGQISATLQSAISPLLNNFRPSVKLESRTNEKAYIVRQELTPLDPVDLAVAVLKG